MNFLHNKNLYNISLLQNNGSTGVQVFQKRFSKLFNEYKLNLNTISPHKLFFLFFFFYCIRKFFNFLKLYQIEELLFNKSGQLILYIILKIRLKENSIIFAQDPLCAVTAHKVILQKKFTNVKVFLFAHYNVSKTLEASIKGYNKKSKIYKLYFDNENYVYHKIDGIIFLNKNIFQKAKKIFKIDERKIFFIKNFINENIRFKKKINKNRFKLINIGTLERRKNQSASILIMKELIKINKNYSLDIYGTGDDKNKLLKLIEKNKLNFNVRLKGYNNNNIFNIMEKYDAILHTPIMDNLPYIIVESFSKGLIPFVYKVGGLSSIIKNNFTGFFITSSFKTSAIKIHKTLKNKKLVNRIRQNVFLEYKKNYTKEVFINNLIKLLSNNHK